MEDPSNRSRLGKLLRFHSSNGKNLTSLEEYVSRAKENQAYIYWLAGTNREEVENSPFVERLLGQGYEVLYMIEAVDEYAVSSLPEFNGKKFQNIAKEGFTLDSSDAAKAKLEELKKNYEPLTNWLKTGPLKERIEKAVVSERLKKSPCALVANIFGWTGNMERLAMSNAHQKTDDPMRQYHLNQKKTLEINPKHPVIKGKLKLEFEPWQSELLKSHKNIFILTQTALLRRVESGETESAEEIAVMLFRTATLRSGFILNESADFADSVDQLMRKNLGIEGEEVEEDDEEVPETGAESESTDENAEENPQSESSYEHEEL